MVTRLRTLTALIVSGLLALTTGTVVSAQDADEATSGLIALCDSNAPDEATLATCLDIVQNVLEPAGGAASAGEPMSVEDLIYGAEDSIGYISFFFGEWTAMDDKGKRPKVGSKKWKKIAATTANDLGAFLMTVEPGPCTEEILLDMWGVYGAFDLAGAGAKAGDQLVNTALTELFGGSMFDFPEGCGPGWVVREERV